ncbi:dUTP diphosphatase [Desulfovibrio sp. SGI.102]|uniref:dUTP diphosphatase n=1 Tax=Desulfovibrio sp. SGI.102 TaxID=3420559 RepID=UPI003CFFF369
MEIKFVKTHPDAVIPTRGSAGSAGFDLTAVSLRRAADLYIYDIGIAMEIPEGYWGGIYARSSLFFTGLEKCGGVCVIDSDYRGSILVMFREVPGDQHARRLALHPMFPGKTGLMHPYKPGDRIAQLIIQPCVMPVMGRVTLSEMGSIRPYCDLQKVEFVEVDHLSKTTRGTGGYGSTGR